MKIIPGFRRRHYAARVSIFLITTALIAGMVGCGPIQYNLTMAADPAVGGTATDLTNASPYTAGTVVNITATAAAGYQFVNWMAPAGTFGSATAATTTFTMPGQDVTVTANFVSSEFYGGIGTAGDPYQIADWHQLDCARNHLDSYFVLVNNLDSTTAGYDELASPTSNGGNGWQPIGRRWIALFTGSFDGQGYEIRDLFINRPSEPEVGLFGHVDDGGHIENIGVTNATVIGMREGGGLVGMNDGTVTNSYSTGSVTGTDMIDSTVGGLVGYNSGTVTNSYSIGSVTGDWFVGGLVGKNRGTGTVSDSYSAGSVNGTGIFGSNVGGLVGFNGNEGTVSNCYATTSVTGGEICVGGLVGENRGTVIDSYSTGNVTGSDYVGGLVGYNYYGNGNVSNSYSTGNVVGDEKVGGLVGWNQKGFVSNSYSTGNVTGNSSFGGLVGQNSGTVSNSFWDTETSGHNSSAGGTGKNTTEMQDITTFSGATWNITAVGGIGERNITYIWNIVNNVTYPFLSWQP